MIQQNRTDHLPLSNVISADFASQDFVLAMKSKSVVWESPVVSPSASRTMRASRSHMSPRAEADNESSGMPYSRWTFIVSEHMSKMSLYLSSL